MSSVADQAADLNRNAWDSLRRQRDAGLVNIRPDSAAAILSGRRFLYAENLELVGDVRGKRLLDMGCGDGAEMLEWARAGAIVTGVDNSPVQLEAARRNADKLGVEVSSGPSRSASAAGGPAARRVRHRVLRVGPGVDWRSGRRGSAARGAL